MKDFRAGRRQDPVMAPMATALSDTDIADLAAYYAGI
jgi:cytochrome c553